MATAKKAPSKRAPRKAESTPKDVEADAKVAAQDHDKADIDAAASAQAVQQLKEQAEGREFADLGVTASTPESVPPATPVVQVPAPTVVETVVPDVSYEAEDPPPPPDTLSTGEVVPEGAPSLPDLIRAAGFDPETTPPSAYEVITRGGVVVEVRRPS